MIIGRAYFLDLREALIMETKSIQKRLRAPNQSPLISQRLQKNLDRISQFLGDLQSDLNLEKLKKMKEEARFIDEVVFKGYTAPVFEKNPASTLINELIKLCKQTQEAEKSQLSFIAGENEKGVIELQYVDQMREYTAITPQSENNERNQFLRDRPRGFLLDGKDVSHLTDEEFKQTLRNFVGIKEPYPEPIQDEKLELTYNLIINTGQEMFEPLVKEVQWNIEIDSASIVPIDTKAFSFSWDKEGDKVFLNIQSNTQLVHLIDERGLAVVSGHQGELEFIPIPDDNDPFTTRPALVSQKYKAEIVVEENKQDKENEENKKPPQLEARLKTTEYSVRCHPKISYKPEMKNYLELEPLKDIKVKLK
jgi:hypothetical protein